MNESRKAEQERRRLKTIGGSEMGLTEKFQGPFFCQGIRERKNHFSNLEKGTFFGGRSERLVGSWGRGPDSTRGSKGRLSEYGKKLRKRGQE